MQEATKEATMISDASCSSQRLPDKVMFAGKHQED